jgi:hypothetical protein
VADEDGELYIQGSGLPSYPGKSLLTPSVQFKQERDIMQAVIIMGGIIALFVILDGISVILFPPAGDELQGYALIAIGIFIILMSWQMGQTCQQPE